MRYKEKCILVKVATIFLFAFFSTPHNILFSFSDVVFDSKLFPSLVSTLKMLMSHMPDGSCAYIASTLRNEQTYTTFKNTLGKKDTI